MKRVRAMLAKLVADERGAHIVEFGLIALPFTVILLALTDFGYHIYLNSVMEGALQRTSRYATVGDKSSGSVDDYLRAQLTAFKNANLTITKKSYSQFSGVGKDEKYTDSNNNNVYDQGVDCYYDDNGNGRWDTAATSGRTGLGGSDDLVYYTVTADFPRVMPLTSFLGFSAMDQVTANMVLRNQPYGSQAFPQCTK